MASRRYITALSYARPCSRPRTVPLYSRTTFPSCGAALFSTFASVAATPAGAPLKNFRLPRTQSWDESTETSLDKATKYFLLSEIVRGMYVVLEQFFRQPYVAKLRAPKWIYLLTDSCRNYVRQLYDILSFRKGSYLASLSRGTRTAALPNG